MRKGDTAATGERAAGLGIGAGVRSAAEAGDAAADPAPAAGDPRTCKPALSLPPPLLLLLSLSKLASISSEISSSSSLPGGGDASSPMPISRPALSAIDSGAAAATLAAAGDSGALIGTKAREILGDCLGVGVRGTDAGAGEAAPDVAESKEEVAAW